MQNAQHKTLQKTDYTIHYFTYGDPSNKAITLLHSAFSDHTSFVKQIDFFAQTHYVIAIDLLCHGLSQANQTKEKIDVSVDYIDDILQLEGIAKTHLIGVSLGALLAQDFAFLLPEKTLSVIAVGGYSIHRLDRKILRCQKFEIFKIVLRACFSMKSFRRYITSVSVKKESSREIFYQSTMHFKCKSLKIMNGLRSIITPRKASHVTYPLLIIIGREDSELATRAALHWYRDEPQSQLLILDDAGHCANIDNAEDFNREVLEFITSRHQTESDLRTIDKQI